MANTIKKVTNADTGTADIVGGDDWDAISDILNLGFADQSLKLKAPTGSNVGTVLNPDFTTNVNCEPFYTLPTYIVYNDSRDNLFKVKSGRRGQIDGSFANCEDAINAAIAIGNSAYIEIRPGTYTTSAGFTGFTAIGTNVYINATRAAINVPAGYSGSVWSFAAAAHGSVIQGGIYSQAAGSSPRLWTCVDMNSTAAASPVYFNIIRDMTITNCGTGIALRTTGNAANGFVNGNIFEDITMDIINNGIVFVHTGTYTDALDGCNRNRFNNVLLQGRSNSLYGVKDVNGRDNEFNSSGIWDLDTVAPSAVSMNITANAKWTYLNGGFLDQNNFADLGTETRWNTEYNWFKNINGRWDGYNDFKTISTPSSPASGFVRAYAKQIDSNNDGFFRKVKVNGAVVEVQF